MNEYRHYRGRGRGNYQHGNNYRNQLGNNVYGSDVRRCNPNHFSPLLPFPPFRETRPRWQRPPQHNNWRGAPPPPSRHFSYVRPYSPTNVQKQQQTRPLSPLPGSEEARQKAIAEASARIKQQLNLAEGDVHYEQCNNTDETQNNISDDCIILNELPLQGPNMLVNNKTQDRKKKHKKSVNNSTSIEELRKKILTQFTYMSKGKIQNLVNNPGSTRYDNALQHLVRDMRLHLSSELRNMYTNRDTDPTNEHDKMIDHFNSIVPDLGIELVSLPDTMVAELSKILQLDVNNEIEEVTNDTNEPNENVLVEPEDMFKQAEKLLSSTDFLNVSYDSINTQNDDNSFPEMNEQNSQTEAEIQTSVCDPLVQRRNVINDNFVHRSPVYNCPPHNINTTPTCTIISNTNQFHPPLLESQQNIRFDEDSIIYDNNVFCSQSQQENITRLTPFPEAVVPVVPIVPLIKPIDNLNKSTIHLDVTPVPEIQEQQHQAPSPSPQQPEDITSPKNTNNENVEKNNLIKEKTLSLNIPLPEESIAPVELEESKEPENTEEPVNAATLKSVEALRDTPVRDDSSPFSKKILQDPIYEDAFKTNICSVNENPQPVLEQQQQQQINCSSNESECTLQTKNKNPKILFNFDSVWLGPKSMQKNTNNESNVSKGQQTTITTKTDTSNNKLNVTSFLQDVITNNLLDLPKDNKASDQSDFIDKRNKFISETSCESTKSLTTEESDCVRPFNRTRSHSPYDLNQYGQEKMTKSRLSLDERIKEMMKIQESRVKPKDQMSPSASAEENVHMSKRKKRREQKLLQLKRKQEHEKRKRAEREKQKRIEREKQKEIERIKQIEREKQKKIEINALKELLKRQQKELENVSNKVKLNNHENKNNNITVNDETPIVDDNSSITSNLLNLNSVTCNLKQTISPTTSKIPIKLISKTKSKPSVKTEPDISTPINIIEIKEEPISEDECSSSSENDTETSADDKNNIIHNLTKDVLNPPKNTKNIRHFERIDTIDGNLNITNKILETPIENFKIIVETNPVKISQDPENINTTIDQNEESNKISEDTKNSEITDDAKLITKENASEIITPTKNNDLLSLENDDTLVEINDALIDKNVEENANVSIENEQIQVEQPVNEDADKNITNKNKMNEEILKETPVNDEGGATATTKDTDEAVKETKDKGEEENKCSDKKHNENSRASDRKQSDGKKCEVSSSSHKKSSSGSSSKKVDDSKRHRHGSVDRKKEEANKASKAHKKSESKHKTNDSKTSSSSSHHHHHHHHNHHHHSDSSSGKQKIINRLLDIDLQIQKLMQEKWNLYKELNITNIEQLPTPHDGDTNNHDFVVNKSKQHSKVPRLSPETKTKETSTPEINVKHISTQTECMAESVENAQQKQTNDGELNEGALKKNKHIKDTKKTPTNNKNEAKTKQKNIDSKKNLRKRKLSESGSSIASNSIQESVAIEQQVEHAVVDDLDTKKQQKPKSKTRQTRNSLNKIDKIDEPVIDEKSSDVNDETRNKNVVPKLKINLTNVKSKMTKHIQNKDDSVVEDEIITKSNHQSDNKIEVDNNDINNKTTTTTTKGSNKKLRSNKKPCENDEVIPTTIINPVESKEETILVINTRKRTAKTKKSSIKELPEDKSINVDKKDYGISELEDNKNEEIHDDSTIKCDEEILNTKRKTKQVNKVNKNDDEIDVEIKKKGARKQCERRNSRNRSATPSSSSSIIIENKIEVIETKPEAITVATKRPRKRKGNTEMNDVESKKSKLTKAEPEIITVNNALNNSDEEVENLLGFNVDNPKEDVFTKTPVIILTNDTVLQTPKTETEQVTSTCADVVENVVVSNDVDDDRLILDKNDTEIDQKRKQIKHNRKLNKIVTDNVSTDSIDNIYIDDDVNVTSYDKLVKSCFVQLERINIKLNDKAGEEQTIADGFNDDVVDAALLNDENLNDILLEDIDFNILDEDKETEHFVEKLMESPVKELDVINENGMFCMGHQKSILDIKIVGDEFFAASEDGTIYKYCLKSGTLQDAYTGHKRAVTCIYTTNGSFLNIESTLLYSGSLDCSLKCYNIDTAEVVHSVTVAQAIQCLDSAWGYIFLGTYEGLLFIYNMKKKLLNEHSLTIANATVLMIKATQEGSRQVLILASRKREIMVRDAFTGLLLRTMCEEQKPTIYSLLLDRSMVYCGTSDKGILILDFNNGQQVGVYNSGKGVVCMLMYRSLLFAGCYDGLIYVYNTKTQKHVSTIPGPGEGMLLSLAICNDVIVAGSKKDHLLKIWKIPQEIFNQIE